MPTIKLGELLVRANVLRDDQLQMALAEKRRRGGRLGKVFVDMRLLSEEVLVRALAKQLGLSTSNLDAIQGIPPHVKATVPADRARALGALPIQLREEGKVLVVAMVEPQNLNTVDALRALTRLRIAPTIVGPSAFERAYARFYSGEDDLDDFEGSFKVVDSQGRTVVKNLKEHERQQAAMPSFDGRPPALNAPQPPPRPRAPAPRPGGNGARLIQELEEVQRREVALIKSLVELMIDRGVFTREEYLAKVRR